MAAEPPLILCVDFGSTYTKAVLVDADSGALLGTTAQPTTIHTDLMDGFDACVEALAATAPGVRRAQPRACSSAGGGLRIVVVGQEALVTAEAGRRVALSSGGIVTGVLSHPLRTDAWDRMAADARPDVVLLTGGTDGGNAAPLSASAEVLVAGSWRGPVVVAGNLSARARVASRLTEAGFPVVPTDNVVPRIGELAPDSARAAIRQMFLAHVIGGKHLSARPEFLAMVRGATPDLVLTGVEVLAAGPQIRHGVAAVDLGGATTDVHSVVQLDAETAALRREVVEVTPVTRTVEGDLGMRWSATATVAAAIGEGLADDSLVAPARRRTADPAFLPTTRAEYDEEARIAAVAVALAVRRHAGRARVVLSPEGRVIERTGVSLRDVDVLVGAGGALRAAGDFAAGILSAATGDAPEGWQLPRAPRLVIDHDHVLAAVGLLADDHPVAAARLAIGILDRSLA